MLDLLNGGGTNFEGPLFPKRVGDTPFFGDLTFSYYQLPYVKILSNLYHFYKSSKWQGNVLNRVWINSRLLLLLLLLFLEVAGRLFAPPAARWHQKIESARRRPRGDINRSTDPSILRKSVGQFISPVSQSVKDHCDYYVNYYYVLHHPWHVICRE